MKVNAREDNYCVFCKHWLGPKAQINHLTGEGDLKIQQGLCGVSKESGFHKSDDLCYQFKKDLLYCQKGESRMGNRVEWMCTYCGAKTVKPATMGRPMPGKCPRKAKNAKGIQGPHSWRKNRTF